MKRLHDFLARKIPAYYHWHKHPIAGTTHWALFIVISCVLTSNLLFVVNSYAQTVDNADASSTLPVVEDTASTTPVEISAPIDIVSPTIDATSSVPEVVSSTTQIQIEADNVSTTSPDLIGTTTVAATNDNSTTTEIVATSTSVTNQILQEKTELATTSPDSTVSPVNTASVIPVASHDILSTSTEPNPQISTVSILTFMVPAIVMNSLTIPVNHFEVSDSSQVLAYMITMTAQAPSSGDSGWMQSVPSKYVLPRGGTKTLYAWIKDIHGIVQASKSARVTSMIFSK
jgi:hypothetical protein